MAGDATCIIGFQIGKLECLLKGKTWVSSECVACLGGVKVFNLGKLLPLCLLMIKVAVAGTISLRHGVLTFDAFYCVNMCTVWWGNYYWFDWCGWFGGDETEGLEIFDGRLNFIVGRLMRSSSTRIVKLRC
jgi:hypothetical protein